MLEQEYAFYLADTDAGKSIHYSLRYQVYCLREKYEDPFRQRDFREQDEYDNSSVHFIVRSCITGEWQGAMRLVIGAVQNLPLNRVSSINSATFSQHGWTRVAEASRLCTLLPTTSRSGFTPLRHTAAQPGSQIVNCRALQSSWITIGLIRAVRQYALSHGIVHCFFLISDPLARILRRLGMEFEPVGSPCLHRGWRRPYVHDFKNGYEAMRTRTPELYKLFCRPPAYARYSELEVGSEELPMAACGHHV